MEDWKQNFISHYSQIIFYVPYTYIYEISWNISLILSFEIYNKNSHFV